jgi:hypothetical protein
MAVPKMEPLVAESDLTKSSAAGDGDSYNEQLKRIKYSLPQNGTQTFQSVRPAELHSADNRQRKADKMSAWRTGQSPMFRL